MIQLVELHYRQTPVIDFGAVMACAKEILESDLGSSDPSTSDKTFLIFHKQHVVQYSDKAVPAATAVLISDCAPEVESYRQEIEQSWRCRAADALLRNSIASCLLTELMAQGLSPPDRVSVFHGVLRAMIDVTSPVALVFKHSQQVVAAADYVSAYADEPITRPGSLNVRFFNIADSGGDMIMDTRGLTAVGLHDLQCHFTDLDPTEVARILFNTAVYIFENGPIINSGETVEGIEPGSKWRCQFEDSMLEPKRTVLDLDPGSPYAAGRR